MTANTVAKASEYQYTWRTLVKGSNGSGFSAILNVEYAKSSSEEKVLKQSILFNCGDSTQQACLQAKLKLQKLTTIIMTSLSPHTTSGLPGMIFALSTLVRQFYSFLRHFCGVIHNTLLVSLRETSP